MRLINIFLLLFILNTSYSQVVLNEIQSSNSSTISDEMNEYDDWIEIYNPNDETVDISDWQLKDGNDDNIFSFISSAFNTVS